MPGPRPNWKSTRSAVNSIVNSIGTGFGIYYVFKEVKDYFWGPTETPEVKFDREAVANLKMTPEEEALVKAKYPDSTEAQQRALVYEYRKSDHKILMAQMDENFKELHKAPNITKDEPKAPDL